MPVFVTYTVVHFTATEYITYIFSLIWIEGNIWEHRTTPHIFVIYKVSGEHISKRFVKICEITQGFICAVGHDKIGVFIPLMFLVLP